MNYFSVWTIHNQFLTPIEQSLCSFSSNTKPGPFGTNHWTSRKSEPCHTTVEESFQSGPFRTNPPLLQYMRYCSIWTYWESIPDFYRRIFLSEPFGTNSSLLLEEIVSFHPLNTLQYLIPNSTLNERNWERQFRLIVDSPGPRRGGAPGPDAAWRCCTPPSVEISTRICILSKKVLKHVTYILLHSRTDTLFPYCFQGFIYLLYLCHLSEASQRSIYAP